MYLLTDLPGLPFPSTPQCGLLLSLRINGLFPQHHTVASYRFSCSRKLEGFSRSWLPQATLLSLIPAYSPVVSVIRDRSTAQIHLCLEEMMERRSKSIPRGLRDSWVEVPRRQGDLFHLLFLSLLPHAYVLLHTGLSSCQNNKQ